jgi:SAM-dependent methyltransferase
MNISRAHFYREYAQHRAHEGRAVRGQQLRALPYLNEGPLARQWKVRARTYDVFVRRILEPRSATKALDILDLGAGNGWLCYRVALHGHRAVALDIRDDNIDGLGAAADFFSGDTAPFQRVNASFEALPFPDDCFDFVVFNASLHYATDLDGVLAQAARVTRPGGALAILDSPFYRREADGDAMVAEKRATGRKHFGDRADVLLSANFIEYLTPERLAKASPALSWARHHVIYPLWYEMRPLLAALSGKRMPSRFDVWTARVP